MENNRVSELEVLNNEFAEFLKSVPLNVREDLEFYFKRINDRLERVNHANIKQDKITESYPKVVDFSYDEVAASLSDLFENISSFMPEEKRVTKPTSIKEDIVEEEVIPEFITPEPADRIIEPEIEEEIAEPIVEEEKQPNVIRHEVIGIKSLKVNEPVQETKTVETEKVSEMGESKPEIDMATNSLDLDTSHVDSAFPGLSQEEKEFGMSSLSTPTDFITETNFSLSDLEDTYLSENKEPIVLKEAPQKPLDSIEPKSFEEEVKENSEDMVKQQIPIGFSLSEIAIALCGDPNGWYDIYEANKESFNKIILEKNNGSFDNIENDHDLFSGVPAVFPTVFLKEVPETRKTLT